MPIFSHLVFWLHTVLPRLETYIYVVPQLHSVLAIYLRRNMALSACARAMIDVGLHWNQLPSSNQPRLSHKPQSAY